jgi:hypothetical protein
MQQYHMAGVGGRLNPDMKFCIDFVTNEPHVFDVD